MSDRTETLLASIDASLKALVAHLGAGPESHAAARHTADGVRSDGRTADDRDLDSQYGDPELRFTPRDWAGPDYKHRHYSECPPELLDMVADSLEYFARRSDETNAKTNSGKPKSEYERKDAARARGWAKRLRDGWQSPSFDPGDQQWGTSSDTRVTPMEGARPSTSAPPLEFDPDDVPF